MLGVNTPAAAIHPKAQKELDEWEQEEEREALTKRRVRAERAVDSAFEAAFLQRVVIYLPNEHALQVKKD